MEFVAGRGYFCASVICVYFSFEKCEPQQILSWQTLVEFESCFSTVMYNFVSLMTMLLGVLVGSC